MKFDPGIRFQDTDSVASDDRMNTSLQTESGGKSTHWAPWKSSRRSTWLSIAVAMVLLIPMITFISYRQSTRLSMLELNAISHRLANNTNNNGVAFQNSERDTVTNTSFQFSGQKVDQEELRRYLNRQNDRRTLTFQTAVLIAAFLMLVGLLKLSLHLNHITHGNYAGRLQFWGGALALVVVAASAGILNQVQLSDTAALSKFRTIPAKKAINDQQPVGEQDKKSSSEAKSSTDDSKKS